MMPYDSFSTNHPIVWAILFALTILATAVAPMLILKPAKRADRANSDEVIKK